MARLPTAADLGRLPSVRTGRNIATIRPAVADTSAFTRGVQDFAQGIQQLGANLQAKQEEAERFDAEQKFQEFRNRRTEDLRAQADALDPKDSVGFRERMQGVFRPDAEEVFATVAPSQQQYFASRVFAFENDFLNNAERFGRIGASQNAKNIVSDNLNNTFIPQAAEGGINALPGTKQEFVALVRNLPIPEIEKDQLIRSGLRDIELAVAQDLHPNTIRALSRREAVDAETSANRISGGAVPAGTLGSAVGGPGDFNKKWEVHADGRGFLTEPMEDLGDGELLIGYHSKTITLLDDNGNEVQHKVTRELIDSLTEAEIRAGSERDYARRQRDFSNKMEDAFEPDVWRNIPYGAQEALFSVFYRHGEGRFFGNKEDMTNLRAAIATKDTNAIADAVLGLQSGALNDPNIARGVRNRMEDEAETIRRSGMFLNENAELITSEQIELTNRAAPVSNAVAPSAPVSPGMFSMLNQDDYAILEKNSSDRLRQESLDEVNALMFDDPQMVVDMFESGNIPEGLNLRDRLVVFDAANRRVALVESERQRELVIQRGFEFADLLTGVSDGTKSAADVEVFINRGIEETSITPTQILQARGALEAAEVDDAGFDIADLQQSIRLAKSQEDLEAAQARLNAFRDSEQITPSLFNAIQATLDASVMEAHRVEQGMRVVEMAYQHDGIFLDSDDSEDREFVDEYYKSVFAAPRGEGDDPFSPERLGQVIDFSNRVGIVPDSLSAFVRSGSLSSNPVAVERAAQVLQQITTANPALDVDIDGPQRSRLELYSQQRLSGSDPEQALKDTDSLLRIDENTRNDRRSSFRDLVDELPGSSGLSKVLNTAVSEEFFGNAVRGFFGSGEPSAPPDMQQEFKRIVETEYVRTGDFDLAQQSGLRQLRKRWAVNRTTGDPIFMRDAPEAHYSIPGMSARENSLWMHEQLMEDIQSVPSLGEPVEFRIVPHPQFVDPTTGKPVYSVLMLTRDATIRPVRTQEGEPMIWVPNFQDSKIARSGRESATSTLDAARLLRRRVTGEEDLSEQSFERQLQGDLSHLRNLFPEARNLPDDEFREVVREAFSP